MNTFTLKGCPTGATIPLSNTTSALLAQKLAKGFYMGGSIVPDQARCACGGKFTKKRFKNDDYWDCEKCNADPKFYRLRRYLPGLMGERGKTVEIRYDQNSKRLTNLSIARATQKVIDMELASGNFDPSKYLLKEASNLLIFRNFVEKRYLPYYEARTRNGSYSPNSMKAKRGYIKNHLMKHLEKVSIKDIKTGTVRELEVHLGCSHSMKKFILEELRVIMNYAKDVAELIPSTPTFPKLGRTKMMDATKFLTRDEQKRVISFIANNKYRAMIEILCHYPIRPSDLRPLKWSDIDWKNGHILIQRHTTINCEIAPGRKSVMGAIHKLPLTPRFSKIMEKIPRPLNHDEFIFPGERTPIVPENRLRKVWAAAIKKAGLPYVDMYRGTKSSTMTQMLKNGASKDDLKAMSGHTNVDQVDRYAQLTDKDMLFRSHQLLMAGED